MKIQVDNFFVTNHILENGLATYKTREMTGSDEEGKRKHILFSFYLTEAFELKTICQVF